MYLIHTKTSRRYEVIGYIQGAIRIKGVGCECEVPDKLEWLTRLGFQIFQDFLQPDEMEQPQHDYNQ